jgi:hypothetical protein
LFIDGNVLSGKSLPRKQKNQRISKKTGPMGTIFFSYMISYHFYLPYTIVGIHDWRVSDLADLDGKFSKLATDVRRESRVVVPNIHDGNGSLIHPQDYATRLDHGTKVVVEVMLKLCLSIVSLNLFIRIYLFFFRSRWNICSIDKSKPSNSTRWRTRDRDDHGSRTYQLIIRKMQILPIDDITKNVFFGFDNSDHESGTNGKRKAVGDTEPLKKTIKLEDGLTDEVIVVDSECECFVGISSPILIVSILGYLSFTTGST